MCACVLVVVLTNKDSLFHSLSLSHTHTVSPNDQMMCMGSDPHFSVHLPSGHTLCYTVQGEHNTNFNLYSSNRLKINARFVPDEITDNTWLGVIGITIIDSGNKATQLMFEASNQQIYIADDVILKASTIEKLVFKDGRLVIVNTPRRLSLISPKVHVDIRDSRLNFTISFVKNQHLDLLWHSTGQDESMHGIIGGCVCVFVCRFGCEGVGVQMRLTLVFGKLASNSTSFLYDWLQVSFFEVVSKLMRRRKC